VPDLSRRRFLQALATSAVGAAAFAGCQASPREALEESRVLLAEDTLTAYEDWFATTCRECGAGCGLVVRVVEGRARKAEGNPDHPVNAGKLCARGQAVVQDEYHPDRVRAPRQRVGPRGANSWGAYGWDDGLDRLVERLRELAARGRGGEVVMITPPLRGHRALIVDRFTRALGAQWLAFDAVGEAPLREAVRRVYGQDRLPDFDVQGADVILSFGADFLGGWLSPVHYGVQYGVFRQGSYRPGAPAPRARGYLVALEPRFSTTAASADEWVPTRPGTEGLLALGIAQVLSAAPELSAFAPEQIEPTTGVAARRLRDLARRFGSAQRPLALGGGPVGAQTNGTEALAAVLGLNVLVGSPAVRFPPPPPLPDLPAGGRASGLADWQDLADRLRAGRVDTVLVFDADPVHGLPASLGLPEALRDGAAFVGSFSSFVDETTALADVVLPAHLPLEDWGDDVPDPGPTAATLSFQQPLLRPLFDTRGFWDVLLVLGEEIGGAVHAALPWPTLKDALREGARGLHGLDRGSIRGPAQDFERFWVSLLQRGGWWDPAAVPTPATPAAPPAGLAAPAFDGPDYPYHLVVFPHNSLGAGRGARLPWLQAAPDPLTSVVWQTWVEVNPGLARQLGVVEGDVVGLESTRGRIEAPVYVHPAAPPDVLGVPLGQGHHVGDRWSGERGANPMSLLAPLVDSGSGALAYAATRVRLAKTGRHVALPKLEGTVPAYQLPGREVIEIDAG
jgi:menaquinone reductase, molybdopterin-binding-like subunit